MKKIKIALLAMVVTFGVTGCTQSNEVISNKNNEVTYETETNDTSELDSEQLYKIKINDNEEVNSFSGEPYIVINDNVPYFSEDEKTTDVFETYSSLDGLGRCGVAYANICQELMPTEEREGIGQVKPTGWHTVKYDCVDGKYLYNRCHLIGYQLAGENANEKNLITGTRYLNIDGMLWLENEVADYVHNTNNHVLYRVTPIYTGDNLLADGVLMEAYSVEDSGEGIQYCIFAYNAQPGVTIDYATGESHLSSLDEDDSTDDLTSTSTESNEYTANDLGITYILNTETKKYHLETCKYAEKTSEENKETFNGTIEWLEDNGYEPCKICKPDKETKNYMAEEYVESKIDELRNSPDDFTVPNVVKLLQQLAKEDYLYEHTITVDDESVTFTYKNGTPETVLVKEPNPYVN